MYVKLFSSILDSSIWSENYPTRLVWITMLAMADAEGLVKASVSGIARRAAVTRKEAEAAMKLLLAPDKDRPDQPHDGRRLEVIEGGWSVLNYEKYREIRTQQQLRDALRQKKHRERSRVSRDTSQEAEAASASASVSTSISKTTASSPGGDYTTRCVVAVNLALEQKLVTFKPLVAIVQQDIALEWESLGVPIGVVEEVLAMVVGRYKSNTQNRQPSSLKYFDAAVREAFEAHRAHGSGKPAVAYNVARKAFVDAGLDTYLIPGPGFKTQVDFDRAFARAKRDAA